MSLVAKNIFKSIGDPPNQILTDISMNIEDGEFVSLTGRSGSGKSTLLYVLSSLDNPTSGKIIIDNTDLSTITKKDLAFFRNQKIGFVFQFHYLISELSVIENVMLPAKKFGLENKYLENAKNILNTIGLGSKLDRLPRQLSGGEQQRVAIARSLVMKPKYLFADEPTGSLDSINGTAVMDMLFQANKENGTTVILVTHDPEFAKLASRQIQLADGKVILDSQLKS